MHYELYKDGFYIGECRCRGKLICYQYASLIVNVCQTRSPFFQIHFGYIHVNLCKKTIPCMCNAGGIGPVYNNKSFLVFHEVET